MSVAWTETSWIHCFCVTSCFSILNLHHSSVCFTFLIFITIFFFLQLMSIARTLLGRRGFSLLLRPTVYAQFVAGEDEGEISQSMEKMSQLGLRPMLAVPIEEDLGESTGYNSDSFSSGGSVLSEGQKNIVNFTYMSHLDF